MHGSSEAATPAGPLERFKPTTGFVLGYISLAFIAVVLVFVVFSVHTMTGLRVGIAMVFAGALIWATQIRPRAAAYSDRVVLKNSLQDTTVPLVATVGVAARPSTAVGRCRAIRPRTDSTVGAGRRLSRSSATDVPAARATAPAPAVKYPATNGARSSRALRC